MVIHVSQLLVTDVWIESVRFQQLASSRFRLVTFELTVQKLKTHDVNLRKVRIELLRAPGLFLRSLHPHRLCWLQEHGLGRVGVSELGVCEREVRVGVNRLLVKI